MLGMPVQERLGIRSQIHCYILDFATQAGNEFGFRLFGFLIMQAAHTAPLAGAGMVDLANVKRLTKGTQTAFTEQPGEVPALIFMALVLHVEQSGQR